MAALLSFIHQLVCDDENGTLRILESDWRNASSVADLPQATQCAQHIDFSWAPFLFLVLGSPVVMYDLMKSENDSARACSPSSIRVFGTFALIFAHAFSLFMNLMNGSPNIRIYGDIAQTAGSIIAFALTIACRNRGVGASGVMFCFWALATIFGFPELCHALGIVMNANERSTLVYTSCFFIASYALYCLNFLSCCFADNYFKNITKRECPELKTSFLNQITFHWFTDLASLGNRKALEMEDLYDLNERDKARTLIPDFDKNFLPGVRGYLRRKASSKSLLSDKFHPSVLIPILRTHKWMFISGAAYKFIFDLLQFAAPMLLNSLISFIQDEHQPMYVGVTIAMMMFLVAAFQSMILHQYFHNMFRVGMNIRTVLTNAVYRKALNLSNTARKNRSTGEIVNLMANDVQRLQDITTFIMLFWSAPLQVTLSIYFLWRLLGWPIIAGLLILIATLPFNAWISLIMRRQQVQQMKFKDERLKLMSEVLNGMKVLKLYAWEESMAKKILDIRQKEINVLKRIAYLNALTSLSWACAPFLVAVLTFGVYVKIDPKENVLTPQLTFVALSLFNILRFPLAIFAMIFSQAIQCSVSNKRLKAFFADDEIDPNAILKTKKEDIAVELEDASFGWDSTSAEFLKNINLSVKKGELVAIVGKVGSGKSSVLSALLGEMTKKSGKVAVNGEVAYIPQQPWIQNLTLRDNVLFGKPLDPELYEKVLYACALQQDLASLPAGDTTEIGEKGINLSGGQKQRVSMARAVYSGHGLIFLDDPLSAVDAHVGKHIFENVISSTTGMLKGTTRVLVTHGIHFLKHCDRVIVMKEGEVSESGTYKELLERQGPFSEFIEEFLIEEATKRGRSVSFGEDGEDMEEILSAIERVDPGKKAKLQTQLSQAIDEQRESTETSPPPSARTPPPPRKIEAPGPIAQGMPTSDSVHFAKGGDKVPLINGIDKANGGKLINKEVAATGKVSWSVYQTYFTAIGCGLVLFFCSIYVFSSILGVLSNLWLAGWSDDASKIQSQEDGAYQTNLRLIIYTALGMGQALTICAASIIMALGMVRASRILHEGMLETTLHSPMAFLDVTPIGRIINRFGKDIDAVDSALPNSIRSLLVTGIAAIATIIVVVWSTPYTVVPLAGLGCIYFAVLRFYVSTSRQLKRLDSTTRSPIFSHFQESIQGASSIRAYHATDKFIEESIRRVDTNLMAYYPSIVANRWLAVRLELVGNLIVLFAAMAAAWFKGSDGLSAGLVGLSVSYALNITQTLNWAVRMTSELETNIVAVERINEYAGQDIEGLPGSRAPADPEWPRDGAISLVDYRMRYREGLDLVLKGVTAHIEPGKKVGIVGRTGAGKSSLTLALFRIVEADGGFVEIDRERIDQLDLQILRSRLTIVPQDPVLFSGTLRENLDPFAKHSDEAVWEAIKESHLETFVRSLNDGLNHIVSESGENLSVGQRQLLCLARALLRKTKVLILDEAAAAVDMETDSLIQRAIREHFKECTVLTIAHRLNTIMDYDSLLVMEEGRIAESGTPQDLMHRHGGIFRSMAKDAGLLNE
ncbi:mrp-1 [Pristionchus pacificus]|nr:mrp-1 [Pristionchus pacificus]